MNLTTATPVEIDTELYALYLAEARAESSKGGALVQIHRAVGDDTSFRKPKHSLTDAEAIAKAVKQAKGDDFLRAAAKGLQALAAAEAAIKAAQVDAMPFHAEYANRGGWTRAFLVTSSTGHVHRSMNCSTCNIRTGYAWMVDYSGKDEAEIVEAAGERACTVCYPSAPVDVLARPTRMFTPDEIDAQAARAKRAEEKKARDAKKLAAAITPDGSELKVTNAHGRRESFKTERAATTWMVQDMGGHKAWGYSLSVEASKIIIEALAAKHGKTVDEVTAEIDAKVAAWIKRNA